MKKMTVLLTIAKTLGILLGSVLGLALLLILILLLLSLFKARLVLEHNGDFHFRLRYLFLAFPKKKEIREKETHQEQQTLQKQQPDCRRKPEEESPPPKAEKKKNLFEKTVQNLTFFDYIEILKRIFRRVLAKITVENFTAEIRIGGDAYETAMAYGKINAAIYPLLGALYNAGTLKKAKVEIRPDFLTETTETHAYTEISLRPIHLLICAGVIVWYLFRKKHGN